MLKSTLTIEKIVGLAKTNQMNAVAINDHNNLFGSLEFSNLAIKNKIQPIISAKIDIKFFEEECEIILIAKDDQGYKNLLKIVSEIYTKNHNKAVDFVEIKNNNHGLIMLSGWINGPIGKALLKKDLKKAKEITNELIKIFGDRFYLEISRHNLKEEQEIEASYLQIAFETKAPIVATNNILFENSDMHYAHDILLCIAEGKQKSETERSKVSQECYFKTTEEMIKLFHDLPSAIENSYYIAQRCSVISETREPILPNYVKREEENEYFCQIARNGLRERIEANQYIKDERNYFDRLEFELSVICKMNFAGYFLIVSDFIKWSKNNSIPVGPGRGSGAGSIVAWSLLITDLDPIRFGLLFERFLNPERISMPDFDIDFCQERRNEVIEYVRTKYGDNSVAQIITFGKLQAKAVIKDVARVLGLRYSLADKISKLVPFNAVNPVSLSQAIEEVDELKQASLGFGIYNIDLENEEKKLIEEVINIAKKLEGMNRHASIHAAGIVISGINLVEIVPLYRDSNSSMNIIQYSMKYAELAGLVKFDFLGLKTLTVIDKCLALIEESENKKINFSKISLDDKKTFEMLSNGASVGVFQFESAGMKDSLRKLKPDSINDIIALGALYRPGPMDNIPTYIACKHGTKEPDYLHPILKEILTETYGVIIYQEQVMKIAQVLSGYSLGSADLLRKAMGKKIKAEMEAQEEIFINGAKNNNIDPLRAKEIFDAVAKFASYGFNKSHATAYGLISYQTAYLKANYPAEFLIALLNLDINDTDKINLFIQEAKILKIPIIAPDINLCNSKFHLKKINNDKHIIFALGAIKNISINLTDEIIAEREKNGKFLSIFNFLERINCNKKLLENLIKSGCFDQIHPNRKSLFDSLERLLAYSSNHHKDNKSLQINMLDLQPKENLYPKLSESMDFDLEEKSYKEFESLGFFLRNHPLDQYVRILEEENIINSSDLNNLNEGSSQIKIAGIVQSKEARMSARGKFIILKLSDSFGIFETTIFNENIIREYSHLIEEKKSIIIEAEAKKDDSSMRININKIYELEQYLSEKDNKVTLTISREKLSDFLKYVKPLHNIKSANLTIEIIYNHNQNYDFTINLPGKFKVTKQELHVFTEHNKL